MITSIQELPSKTTPSLVPTRQSGSTQNDTSDVDLIQRAAAGDASSMRVLYTRHSLRVYRFILRFIDNEAVAEEVVNADSSKCCSACTVRKSPLSNKTWKLPDVELIAAQ
jgi:hypothetical protein